MTCILLDTLQNKLHFAEMKVVESSVHLIPLKTLSTEFYILMQIIKFYSFKKIIMVLMKKLIILKIDKYN